MNLPQLIHRLRRVASGELCKAHDLPIGGVLKASELHAKDCQAWANACFDKTPITEEWIRELGVFLWHEDWECWRTEGIPRRLETVGEFWYFDDHRVTTRGQLIQLLSALGVWDE